MRLFDFKAIFASCFVVLAGPAQANIFEDVWGIVTDPLKIRSGSKEISRLVDRTIVSLELLQDEFDEDVTRYIRELQNIVLLADSATAERISQAKQAALEVEKRVFDDAQKLLVDAECAVERLAGGTLPRTLYTLLKQIEDSGISVSGPLGIEASLSLATVEVVEPDRAYVFVRNTKMSQLAKLGDGDYAYEIISTYQGIAELAFRTYCHYQKTGGVAFLREYSEYVSRMRPWFSVVTVRPQF